MSPPRITPLDRWIRKRSGLLQDSDFTREGLQRYQLAQIRKELAYAAGHSPYYRRQLGGRIDFSGLNFDEFVSLPLTTSQDLCRNPLEFLCVSHSEIARVVTIRSSGTTGLPKRLFFTGADLEPTIDFFQHGMSTLVQAGQHVLILMPGGTPGSIGDLLVQGLNRMGATATVCGPVQDPADAIDKILSRRAHCLVGIPVQVLSLARHAENTLIPRRFIHSVLLSTDYVPASIVEEIERTWDCHVYQHYGMTEMGYGGGVECDANNGYHLREADLFVEIVDPQSGRRLPEGVFGEVVFTTLTRRAMPLIRYRTGDRARFLTEPCPCGSILRRLSRVPGRLANEVTLGSSIRLRMAALDEAVFAVPQVLNFRVELIPADGFNRLRITIHCDHRRFGEASDEVRKALAYVPAVRAAVARRLLEIDPVKFSPENWFTSGAAKRTLIDRRQEEPAA